MTSKTKDLLVACLKHLDFFAYEAPDKLILMESAGPESSDNSDSGSAH